MTTWKAVLTPNASVSDNTRRMLAIGWLVSVLLVWQFGNIRLLPRPEETFNTIWGFWKSGVVYELFISITTMMKAMFFTCAFVLTLAYLTVVPAVKPVATAFATLRFLGLTGLTLAFTMMTNSGDQMKVLILTFGVSTFFLKDMIRVVEDIPKSRYNHARTLGMGPWRVMWEVTVRGTLDQALDSLRVNAAMGWMMLTMVEGLALSGGGIGAELWKSQRHMDLVTIMAIQLMIFTIGMMQDQSIGLIKTLAFPHTRFNKAK